MIGTITTYSKRGSPFNAITTTILPVIDADKWGKLPSPMFEEIPSPPSLQVSGEQSAAFAVIFSSFFVGSAIAWFRWSHPLSVVRKIATVEFILGLVVSGVCLLSQHRVLLKNSDSHLKS
jgi:hypothetical protein